MATSRRTILSPLLLQAALLIGCGGSSLPTTDLTPSDAAPDVTSPHDGPSLVDRGTTEGAVSDLPPPRDAAQPEWDATVADLRLTGPLDVRAFGAIPDDGQDDAPAIRAALAQAVARGGPVEVRFEGGTYRLSSQNQSHLRIDNASGITLAGVKDSTRLLFTDPTAHGISLDGCQDIAFRGLTIDYDPLPYTQGTIVAVDRQAGSFDLALDAGYPRFSHPMFDASAPVGVWGIVVDGRKSYDLIPVFPQGQPSIWQAVGANTFRIVAQGGAAQLDDARIAVGARYVSLARGGGIYARALSLWRTKGLTIESMTIHASPGVAMLLAQCEDVLVDDYHVAFPANGDRLLTTDADGIHCVGQRGSLEIRNSSFAGMADDSINIHARAGPVRERRSNRELKIAYGGTVAPRVGEEIAVYDPEGGSYRGRARVTAVTPDGAGAAWLTFDRDVGGVVANTDPTQADWLFNLDACGAGAQIHHNAFGRHRGRAMVLRGIDIVVHDNTVENVDGLAVFLAINSAYYEGPIPSGITVRDNVFSGVDAADNPRASPAIATSITKRSGGYATSAPIDGVRIWNNRFEGLKGLTMRVNNAQGFQVLGNWTNNTRQNKVISCASIDFAAGVSASLSGYAVTDHNPQTYAGIHIRAGANVSYQNLNMNLAAGVPWVRDDN